MKRNSYTAQAFRCGNWWAIRIDGVPFGYTQARSIDNIDHMARSALVDLELEPHPRAFDLVVIIDPAEGDHSTPMTDQGE